MTPEQKMKSLKTISLLIDKHESLEEFANLIGHDKAAVCRWRKGRIPITARAVISICRIYKDTLPYDLNADAFPPDLRFEFFSKKAKKNDRK